MTVGTTFTLSDPSLLSLCSFFAWNSLAEFWAGSDSFRTTTFSISWFRGVMGGERKSPSLIKVGTSRVFSELGAVGCCWMSEIKLTWAVFTSGACSCCEACSWSDFLTAFWWGTMLLVVMWGEPSSADALINKWLPVWCVVRLRRFIFLNFTEKTAIPLWAFKNLLLRGWLFFQHVTILPHV